MKEQRNSPHVSFSFTRELILIHVQLLFFFLVENKWVEKKTVCELKGSGIISNAGLATRFTWDFPYYLMEKLKRIF